MEDEWVALRRKNTRTRQEANMCRCPKAVAPFCLADNCMAWRWVDDGMESSTTYVQRPKHATGDLPGCPDGEGWERHGDPTERKIETGILEISQVWRRKLTEWRGVCRLICGPED